MLKFTRASFPIAVGIAALAKGHQRETAFSAPAIARKAHSARTQPLSAKEKVVLITGATAGIGESCAWRFAEEGSKLVLIGRRENRLQQLKKDIISSYPSAQVHTVAMSVTDLSAVAALPNNLPAQFKSVDILVNNAGLALGVTAVDENSVSDAKTVLDTNILGIVAFSSAFLPGMKKRGVGHIINIGSVAVSLYMISSCYILRFVAKFIAFHFRTVSV